MLPPRGGAGGRHLRHVEAGRARTFHATLLSTAARSRGCILPLSKRGPRLESNTPLGTLFRRDARDRSHRRDHTRRRRRPRVPRRPPGRWAGTRSRAPIPDATAAPTTITSVAVVLVPRARNHNATTRRATAARAAISSTTGCSGPMHRARDRRRPSSSRDRSRPRRPRRLRPAFTDLGVASSVSEGRPAAGPRAPRPGIRDRSHGLGPGPHRRGRSVPRTRCSGRRPLCSMMDAPLV